MMASVRITWADDGHEAFRADEEKPKVSTRFYRGPMRAWYALGSGVVGGLGF